MNAVRNRIEVMHGVNLDQLGRRDPDQYGTLTLDELEVRIKTERRSELGLDTRFFQSQPRGRVRRAAAPARGPRRRADPQSRSVDALLLRDP